MTYIIYTLTTLPNVIKDHIFNILEFVVKLSSERAKSIHVRYILVLDARLSYTSTTLPDVIKDHIFNILEYAVKLSSERARTMHVIYILASVARLSYTLTTLPYVIKDHVFNILDNVLFKICAGTIIKVRRLEQFM